MFRAGSKKRITRFVPVVNMCRIEPADANDDRKPYLQIDRVEGLIAMGQIAAVEFYPIDTFFCSLAEEMRERVKKTLYPREAL